MIRIRRHLNQPLLFVIIILLLILIMFPLAWMMSTSLKEQQFLIDLPPQWIPRPLTLEHYFNAMFREMEFFVLLKNSLIVSLGTSLTATIFGSLAAYSFSRYRFAGSDILLIFLLAGQMFPGVMMVIPFYVILRESGMLDSYLGLIIANTSLALPFATYMLKGFFDSLPTELEDAAMIDGCSRIGVLFKIALPLTLPGLITTILMTFIVAWDDYILALTLVSSESLRTLPVGIVGSFVGEFSVKWGEMMAASILMSLPVVLLFLFLQKYLIKGLTAGAVKG